MPRSFDKGRELERYLALTLCLDDALKAERQEEATSLLKEREEVLSRLEAAKVVLTEEEVAKIGTAEKQTIMWLQHTRSHIGESIRATVKQGAMSRAYGRANGQSASGFSRAS